MHYRVMWEIDVDANSPAEAAREAQFSVTLEPDIDSTPMDADCYEAEDIDAWRENRWQFVTVVVTLQDEQGNDTEFQDYLSGVEFGYSPGFAGEFVPDGRIGWAYITGVHPVPDMVMEVISRQRKAAVDAAWESYVMS